MKFFFMVYFFILATNVINKVDCYYSRIKKFRVTDVVDDFLIRNDIINCFKKEEAGTLFLKCWRNNELVNVEIFIESNGYMI